VASHSTAAALHPHIRSKPDEVIQAIADSGGYIGICCISRFLRGKGDLNALLDHIDHVVKKFGVDHVAIGTDIAYTSRNSAEESKKAAVGGLRRKREDFRSLWPKDDFLATEEEASRVERTGRIWPKDDFLATEEADLSIAWTNWPLYTVGLVQRGYSDDDIRKILGGNVMRVLRVTEAE
jgi:membrane dipeptidase